MALHCSVLVFLLVALSLQPVHLANAPLFAWMRKFIRVEYFEDCGQNGCPMKLVNFTFARNGSDLVLNGEEIVTRDIKSQMKIQFLIDKCRDKSNPDTCEYYNTWKWDDMCAALQLPFIKIIMNASTPPHSCPAKKNHYHIKNAKISADAVAIFLAHSDPNVLWKFRVEGKEEYQTILCCEFGLRIVNVRVRV